MSLASGVRLGSYEVVAPLGAGGMGEVYRARDTRRSRDVALKVLPEAFADDPERMARFEREAQVLASLNHPNIAQLYGLEERALVMEYVPGETLRGPLPGKPPGTRKRAGQHQVREAPASHEPSRSCRAGAPRSNAALGIPASC